MRVSVSRILRKSLQSNLACLPGRLERMGTRVSSLSRRNRHSPLAGRRHIWPAAYPANSGSYSRDFHPFIVVHEFDFDIDAYHAIGSKLVGFELHAAECQFAGLVHQLGVFPQFALEIALDAG